MLQKFIVADVANQTNITWQHACMQSEVSLFILFAGFYSEVHKWYNQFESLESFFIRTNDFESLHPFFSNIYSHKSSQCTLHIHTIIKDDIFCNSEECFTHKCDKVSDMNLRHCAVCNFLNPKTFESVSNVQYFQWTRSLDWADSRCFHLKNKRSVK